MVIVLTIIIIRTITMITTIPGGGGVAFFCSASVASVHNASDPNHTPKSKILSLKPEALGFGCRVEYGLRIEILNPEP